MGKTGIIILGKNKVFELSFFCIHVCNCICLYLYCICICICTCTCIVFRSVYKIEYAIADKRGKLLTHLEKWEKLVLLF